MTGDACSTMRRSERNPEVTAEDPDANGFVPSADPASRPHRTATSLGNAGPRAGSMTVTSLAGSYRRSLRAARTSLRVLAFAQRLKDGVRAGAKVSRAYAMKARRGHFGPLLDVFISSNARARSWCVRDRPGYARAQQPHAAELLRARPIRDDAPPDGDGAPQHDGGRLPDGDGRSPDVSVTVP